MVRFADTFLKRLRDNRVYWNVVEGPLYNVFIYRILDGAYDDFFRTLPIPARAHILDVGSGAGQATLRLAKQQPEASIYAIDYAATQVHIAQLLQRHRKVHNTEFKVADAMDIPFHDEVFDVVVSLASIKHWSDAKHGLAEIYRVLKSGGVAYILECDAGATRKEIDELAEQAARFFLLKRAIAWYQEHVVFGQSYSKAEVFALAQNAGFSDILVERMVDLPFLRMVLSKEKKMLLNGPNQKEDT
jgi:ubiquinone/menaquinone biosynthesis C-methylase UbiE